MNERERLEQELAEIVALERRAREIRKRLRELDNPSIVEKRAKLEQLRIDRCLKILEMRERPMTYDQIGIEFGLSRTRAMQLAKLGARIIRSRGDSRELKYIPEPD